MTKCEKNNKYFCLTGMSRLVSNWVRLGLIKLDKSWSFSYHISVYFGYGGKSGNFSDQVSVQLGSQSQNVLKADLKIF